MEAIVYDLVKPDELEAAHKLEVDGFPEDEAGSLEAFRFRQSQAPSLFLGAYLPTTTPRTLVGYVCATRAAGPTLTHDSMSTHDPTGPTVCIHSVCVARSHHRRGVGVPLVRAYLAHLAAARTCARAVLITHPELVPFYTAAGFADRGPSAVVHGPRPWVEMCAEFSEFETVPPAVVPDDSAEQAVATQLPPGVSQTDVLAALQRASASARTQPTARLLPSFPGGVADVRAADGANAHDLVCPRAGCGSVILKTGAAEHAASASVRVEPEGAGLTRPECLGALPAPPAQAEWWLVRGSAMAFENIGFSRPVQGLSAPGGGRMKLLACAECDLGPLGWCEEGGREFWLACNRVGYRV
ncbi:acyl-CoA N-acyltransferase [Epithele typhae]|uniref:acyl-CoA N-acyltransferase n=1 Tax=Epithele typhae TaxID=378194 RepID=UPI0020073B42|nr:acyl-CoA N-acyltransferase [Epithele typhae]KAH9919500.1 acyl-CoA N-acyltransferase [Epithele typhae]